MAILFETPDDWACLIELSENSVREPGQALGL